MLRILRAFAWMRWRIFVNSFEKTSSRDRWQRLSIAVESLAPIVVALIMVPSALALTGLAGYTGVLLARGGDASGFLRAMRALLLVATAFAIIGPIVMPGTGRVNPVRLLLLPIPARTLYVAQAAGALADPWILLLLPIVIGVPIGLLGGGAPVAAVLAAVAALPFVVTMIGITALAATVVHLILRDRRRGELVGLAFLLLLPFLSLLPMLMAGSREPREARQSRQARMPPWAAATATTVWSIAPSQLYADVIANAAARGASVSPAPLAALLVSGAAVHGIGLLLFRRALASPGSSGARRIASTGLAGRRLPGVSPGTSAVALAFWKLALRTAKGRSILIAPLVLLVFFGVIMLQRGSFLFGPFETAGGFALAALTSNISLISILTLAMNQFAVDRAGLTLVLLSPLTTRQILAGKAIGGALIIMPPALLCIALAGLVFPGGSPALWLALPPALAATYILATPAAAVLSTLFPVLVDLNSIGAKAHGLAGLAGLLAFAAAGAPPAGLILFATGIIDRPWLAPVLVLLWSMAAVALVRVLFVPAERIFEQRREALATLV